MKRSLILLILLSATLAFAQNPETAGTIFLVRHAEKVSDASDALLNKTGEQRATCLAQTLRDSHIGAIYVTEVKRTQQTAEPLAKSLGVELVVVKANDTAALASKVRHDLSSKNVLVVGHSDTLPKVLSELGVTGVPSIGRNEYDFLFVANHLENKPELTTLHYCPSARKSAPSQSAGQMRRMR